LPLPPLAGAFQPPPWGRGGHRQTILGFLARRSLRWTLPTEDLVVPSEEGVQLLVRASWQEGPREKRPALVLTHGLGGCDASSYIFATALFFWRHGYHVLRMNMRGAGDAIHVCPRLYHAGLDSDLLAVLERVAKDVPRLVVAGFSLGANVTALALGRLRGRLPEALRAAGAVSPPLDLAASVVAIGRLENRLYQAHFMANLRHGYRLRQRLLPALYEAGLEARARTVREYDELITARYGGFEGADDYYARSSAGPFLAAIRTPTLLLAAEDDPMIPARSLSPYPLPTSGTVVREILPTGGHVGFVGRTEVPGRFWAAERLLRFFATTLEAS
jgi:predicted alpha/beta-fold hydrolase